MKGYPTRAFTPDITNQRRPQSRYNKNTLFAGLENGRNISEYKVPIIDMKLNEYKWQNAIIPSIWN